MVDIVTEIVHAGWGIELFLTEADYEPLSDEAVDAISEICRTASTVTAHTSVMDWDQTGLLSEIRLASRLGAELLIIHPGTLGFEKCDNPFERCENPPDISILQEICKQALDSGLRLALENTGRTGASLLTRILDLVGTDDSGLGICIDTGHANRRYNKDSMLIEEYFHLFSDLILEVHINDNFGKEDLHLPPGKGTIDWQMIIPVINTLSNDVIINLELAPINDPFSALQESIEYLRHCEM